MKNRKYEITDIAHETYPWLHRIRALRDIGDVALRGKIGGFVESESNLSFESGDNAWVADDAICCGTAYVDKNAQLKDRAIACGHAYVTAGAVLSFNARAEDDAYVHAAIIVDRARASGCSIIRSSPTTGEVPELFDECTVYGKVVGDVKVKNHTLILASEEVYNDTPDTFVLRDSERFVLRDPSRDRLTPTPQQRERPKEKNYDRSR